jgi:glucose-1-phosphate cytidylyltransferase|tara:strand:- start:1529 stop:2263 length:735 start_codon:yes stop_codon:yes gene_type:complete
MYNSAMILAGGLGTRFAEYTDKIPKPMILANGKPLLEHITSIYSRQGVKNIIVLAGYKSEKIVEYYDKISKKISTSENIFKDDEGTLITILDTGLNTMTGGRLKEGINYLNEDNFYLTYGDGIADVNLNELTLFFDKSETIATLTAFRPPARFGSLDIDEQRMVTKFGEKDNTNSGWVNGGFFVFNKSISGYIDGKDTVLEKQPLEVLARNNELSAYFHDGFWQPCDTIRELEVLEKAMNEGLI